VIAHGGGRGAHRGGEGAPLGPPDVLPASLHETLRC
jgi:hypothetical protein